MPSTKQIELKILDKRIGENSQFPLPSYKTLGAAGLISTLCLKKV